MTLEQALARLSKRVYEPHTRTYQFYSSGRSRVSLPPGAYSLKVFKGVEYKVETRALRVEAGRTLDASVTLARWIDLPARGWYSADDHLHIPRPVPGLNAVIAACLQAEDIHVGNLLQWGNSKRFHNTLQYAHGPAGLYREGDFLLASGQENPRTHILGHTITLGAQSPINFPDAYLIYRLAFEEARRQKALSGYAHFGNREGAETGLSVDLPGGLVSFVEVLQLDTAVYHVWYHILNAGFRLAPVAGTDYPCFPGPPGRERFYTKVEGPLTFEAWLDGVRRGRTFVTNGPILEFAVEGRGIGDEVALPKPGPVSVEGRVLCDPARDRIERVEVIENGMVVKTFEGEEGAPEIRFQFQHEVAEASWLAVRAAGKKRDEATATSPSLAHSAPVYVTIEGRPGLSAHPRAKALARAWLARLDALEARLADDKIEGLARWPGHLDGVEADFLRKGRPDLREAIRSARERFEKMAQ